MQATSTHPLCKAIPPKPLPALIFSYSTTLHTYLIEHNFIPAVTKTQLILYLHTHLTEAHLNTLVYVLAAYREPLYVEAL